MTLQLALDGAEKGRTLAEAMALARAARKYTDVIEVGTSFVLRDGLAAVEQFARAGFGVPILADVKIMDCGAGLCAMACEAGADIVTVMCVLLVGIACCIFVFGILLCVGLPLCFFTGSCSTGFPFG